MRLFYCLGGGGEQGVRGWGLEIRGSDSGFFVQHFSIFPRFLRCEWAWVSSTLEGIFLMFAKLGEVISSTKVENSTFF
jgi:hypothetical protein